MKTWFALLILLAAAAPGADSPAASPPPKKRGVHVCNPYVEKCPACVNCKACRACSKEGNRCSVKRAQLGLTPPR